jgi:hypothetical protein
VVDGVAALVAATAARPAGLPPELALPAPGDAGDAGAVLDALLDHVRAAFGDAGTGDADADAWRPERLEYGLEVLGAGPDGAVVLSAVPDSRGQFDWYSFDEKETGPTAGAPSEVQLSVLPTHVRFRGMPNPRWWVFERAGTDFGKARPDRRGVAMLVGLDFMLLHSNDWYVVPLPVDVARVSWVDRLVVHDVFGGTTEVHAVDARSVAGRARWTMFSTAVVGRGRSGSYLVLPPSAGTATLEGPAVEDVRFVRDEMANMVWAIEHTVENAVGRPWPGPERSLLRWPPPPDPGPAPEGSVLRYTIQTVVPGHWVPFVPVSLDAFTGEIALERAAMTRPAPGADDGPVVVDPVTRVLRNPPLPYRIREEEVPREGRRVVRAFSRSRWIDGSTHVWVSRRSTVGRGEASSGLRFDAVDDVPPAPPA